MKRDSPHTPKNTKKPIPLCQMKKPRKIGSFESYVSPILQDESERGNYTNETDISNEEETEVVKNYVLSKMSKPMKTCMKKRRNLKETPNSSYLEEISPGIHEIIIDGLSGPLYLRLVKDSVEAYESMFYKQITNLLNDDDAIRNRLIGNLQMTKNMFRNDLDLWVACILFHPQMGAAYYDILYYLKTKCNMWLSMFRDRTQIQTLGGAFNRYEDNSETIGPTPAYAIKKNGWQIYVSTLVILGITSVFIGVTAPQEFRELLYNLADSVLKEN